MRISTLLTHFFIGAEVDNFASFMRDRFDYSLRKRHSGFHAARNLIL